MIKVIGQKKIRMDIKIKNIIKKILKLIWNIAKHFFLLPMYCSLPDKYNGTTYEEWIQKNNY